jgi:Helix-turn-helix domain
MTDALHKPQMMDIEQASEYLRIPVDKIRTLCQERAQTRMGDNRLPHFRVGRALYFTQSALIHWVQKMKKTGGAK